jgi:hypothetical protein
MIYNVLRLHYILPCSQTHDLDRPLIVVEAFDIAKGLLHTRWLHTNRSRASNSNCNNNLVMLRASETSLASQFAAEGLIGTSHVVIESVAHT